MSESSRKPQRSQAYNQLRRLLILQQLPAGERLREGEWAERLGVHRTALREAFARLEAEGLIDLGPKTGYFVPALSESDMEEVIEVRLALEGVAIERICRLGLNTPLQLAGVREACEQLERLIQEGYHLGVSEADRRFHETLVAISGNHRLIEVYARAPLPIIHRRILEPGEWLEAARHTLSEHRSILAATLGGDVVRARDILCTHLTKRYLVPLQGG
jgi:DNA-binding GntR family transcriptional regulator